jgi:hypothetical protein
LAAIEEACKKIANVDSSGITGDAQALLTVISKPSHFHSMCVCGRDGKHPRAPCAPDRSDH